MSKIPPSSPSNYRTAPVSSSSAAAAAAVAVASEETQSSVSPNKQNENSSTLLSSTTHTSNRKAILASTVTTSPSPSIHHRRSNQVWIGGPGSVLPRWLESLLAWILAFSCLSVALYFYYHNVLQKGTGNIMVFSKPPITIKEEDVDDHDVDDHDDDIPLMTYTRDELANRSLSERWHQLKLYFLLLQQSHRRNNHNNKQKNNILNLLEWSEEEWIQTIRQDPMVRRLVSLIRRHIVLSLSNSEIVPLDLQPTIRMWKRIWPFVLELPEWNISSTTRLVVIIVAYREDGRWLRRSIQQACDLSTRKDLISWVVVDAGKGKDMDALQDLVKTQNLKLNILEGKGGGRGPCLNQGAAVMSSSDSRDDILVFLHADTRLEPGWDDCIRRGYQPDQPEKKNITVTATAFSFAIDTARTNSNDYIPPGLNAIQCTANLRTKWFQLPYGDQCLTIPRVYFDYLGGYPHQCLMEDYEFVALLRHRHQHFSSNERIHILPQKAHCGARRWQNYGVLYVTWTNSRCVQRYKSEEWSPQRLFEYYYGYPVANASSLSPWEVQLENLLTVEENIPNASCIDDKKTQ